MRRVPYQQRLLLLVLAAGLPAVALALGLLWASPFSLDLRLGATALLLVSWIALAGVVQRRLTYTLNTVANLLESLRREDFSIRARRSVPGDVLDTVFRELNELAETLQGQRLGALEATALLRKVMGEIEVAVFAFDPEHRLRLANRAAERLLRRPVAQLLGQQAQALGLGELLQGPAVRTLERAFPGAGGPWALRRSAFRERGLPHQLVVLADLSQALREEERRAWQRLIRVLGHELNNSLAPIKSMAATLRTLLARHPPPADREEDLSHGLETIEERAAALARFMGSYARLAQLPTPRPEPIELAPLCARLAALENRLAVEVVPGPPVPLHADPAQLEQALINLVRNAADAAIETGGGVRLGWRVDQEMTDLTVEDDGPGLAATANLFVPFFTTKPGGSGIGLVLSRQIAEAHGGSLVIENRTGARGCVARLRLPLAGGGAGRADPPAR
jgi:two-component system, NtrC family, nitrogen regulation sensor histidine kinase NtrY